MLLESPVVELNVFVRWAIPAPIVSHAAQSKLPEQGLVVVPRADGTIERVIQAATVCAFKIEAIDLQHKRCKSACPGPKALPTVGTSASESRTLQGHTDEAVCADMNCRPHCYFKSAHLHAILLSPLDVVVHIKHSVRQATRFTHHRDRAIAHANHLCQTARLKHGRHKDHVAAGIDEVAEGLVERKIEASSVVVLVLQVACQAVEVTLQYA